MYHRRLFIHKCNFLHYNKAIQKKFTQGFEEMYKSSNSPVYTFDFFFIPPPFSFPNVLESFDSRTFGFWDI